MDSRTVQKSDCRSMYVNMDDPITIALSNFAKN